MKKSANMYELPSGSWQVRKQFDGKRYAITFDHKPTKKEIDERLMELRMKKGTSDVKDSFKACAEKHIQSNTSILSVTTIKSYKSFMRIISDDFLKLRIKDIDNADIQMEVNRYASTGVSPKTVKNFFGFIRVVMAAYNPDMHIRVNTPSPKKHDYIIPSDDEAKRLMNVIKGSMYECVILLGMMGLRKSEAIAITKDDVVADKKTKQYMLKINKALVSDENNNFVLQNRNKTYSSTRIIIIPKYIAELIKSQGRAYTGSPNTILKNLHLYQDACGAKRTTYHALRHYYVSMAHSLGIPDVYIAQTVGHSDLTTTRNVYTHAQSDILKKNEEITIQHMENFLNLGKQ